MRTFTRWLREELFQFSPMSQHIAKSGLGVSTINLIKQHAAGMMDIKEYLSMPAERRPGNGGFALGISGDMYNVMSFLTDAEHWKVGYKRVIGSPEMATDKFLTDLTDHSSPQRPIVFFMPSEIFSHPQAMATSDELRWFLEHPEKMKNTYFIFGLYDMTNKKTIDHYRGIDARTMAGLVDDYMKKPGTHEFPAGQEPDLSDPQGKNNNILTTAREKFIRGTGSRYRPGVKDYDDWEDNVDSTPGSRHPNS